MDINNIMAPIQDDLVLFQKEIIQWIEGIKNEKVKSNFMTFFKKKGKYLRPSLLMLSANAVTKGEKRFENDLYKLALILELLHSASLVHDDIVDGDIIRRGEATINHVFGNKIAVLAGDTLFSYAFALVTEMYSKVYGQHITNLALSMCMAELEQANEVTSLESYLSVIYGKTAKFMSICCELGGIIGGANEEVISSLSAYGEALGMAYQIIDDSIDEDPNGKKYVVRDDANDYIDKGREALSVLEDSEYKESLSHMLEYVASM